MDRLTVIAKDGPRRALLWLSDLLIGLRMARYRVMRRTDVDGATIHTMPSPDEVEGAVRLFSKSFDIPSEVRVLRRLSRVFPWATIVLKRGGAVEGYCFFRILRRKKAILLSMAVAEALRGQGFGRLMLSFGLSLLREAGLNQVDLDVEEGNEAALRLYAEHGFTRQGAARVRGVIRMSKGLRP